MLRENNVRAGFFEHAQYLSVLPRLPEAMRPVVTFAYVTGWRINSEGLPLQWRQVDLKAGAPESQPDAPAVFPTTSDARPAPEAGFSALAGSISGTISAWYRQTPNWCEAL
jgi:hypothetical protein